MQDTRDIEHHYGPDNGASFPDAEPGDGSGGLGPATSIPTDKRSNTNGSPRGGRR